MKILKLVLLSSLVTNSPKIQTLKDLNKIGIFRWDLEVTRNPEAKSEIIEILRDMTPKTYLEEVSNTTALLLDGTAKQDSRLQSSLNNIFRDATVLEQKSLQNKILKAAGVVMFKAVGGYLAVVGGVYYGIQGIKYAFAQMIQPYFDRWGKHREFLAKLKPMKIKELRNPMIGYNLMRKQVDRLVHELKEQMVSGNKINIDGWCLYGKPGNGKTAWVECIAYKTGLPLIVVNFNDLINSKSGTVEENLTLLFKELRRNAPCICFFDEIDLMLKNKPEVLAQLLQELDGLKSKKGVFIIAATNEKEAMRESLLRPGRFGVHFELSNPQLSDIQLLVELYLTKKGIFLEEYMSYDEFIASLEGLSCAGIKAYCEVLEKLCKENNTNAVTESFIDEANFIYKR